MASARSGLVIRPVSQFLSGVRSLYQKPPESISGISLEGWFSPFQPVQPYAPPGTEPRSFQTWSGQNLIFTPRADAEMSAADLKALASYPLARICIENVKDAVSRAPWEIQLRPQPRETRQEVANRAKGDEILLKLNRFFEYPDREHNWQEWLRPLLDDMLVIDAASILIRKTFNGDIAELPVIAGEMIVRYVDEQGFTPLPPSPAYAQNWWGLPLVNLTTDQLIYKPRNIVRRNTLSSQLYGMAPTEQLADEIQVGIKRLQFVLSYYTEGSVPGVVQVVPRGTPPDRIEEAMEWMNSQLAGNLAKRNQWRLVQGFNEPGKDDQIIMSKEPLLAGLYDEKHIRELAFGYGTSPQRLLKMIRTEGQGSSDAAEIEGTLPWVLWLKGVVDFIIQRKMGLIDYEIALNPYAEPDPLKNAAAITMLVAKTVLTPNEARKRVGEDLRPEPEADRLGVITGTGFIPVGVAPVVAGVQTDDQGNVKPHPVKPTEPPAPKGPNATRGSKPPQQEAGGGRSTGKNPGTPSGKESVEGKKKIQKRLGSRIDSGVLTVESEQAVHATKHALETVFRKQLAHATGLLDHKFRKAFGSALEKREFGNVQFHLSPPDAQKILAIMVRGEDFAAKGRDMNPHVTVRWGFHQEVTAAEINAITRGIGDVPVTLGAFEAFPLGPDGVPLVIRIESEKLRKLNADLAALPHTNTHPEYKPHICVAYLKPEAPAEDYVAAGNPLAGETFILRDLVYSGIDYTMEDLEKLLLPSQRLLRISKKFSKPEVDFESPAKGPHHCSECVHFLATAESCEIVTGKILPGDWCKRFEPK
jgi:2'-5' RNA ligase superfamily